MPDLPGPRAENTRPWMENACTRAPGTNSTEPDQTGRIS